MSDGDANDVLRAKGEDAVRERHARSRKFNSGDDITKLERRKITATPYVWRDPKSIPPRDFLYGNHYVRRYLSVTVSTGGVGKSSEVLTEAIAMVTGRELIGIKPKRPLRVWYINLEDPKDETYRRLAAIYQHHEITPMDIGDRLFVDSGRETKIVIATETKSGMTIAAPVVEDIIATIKANKIDCLIVDPFVGCVEIGENDNNRTAMVCREWLKIAEQCNCAIELIHHVRKGASGRDGYTIEDARGATAMINSARSARVLNTMSKDEGERAGVDRCRSYFRIDGGKQNLTPPPEHSEWRRIISVDLDNATADIEADRVGVVVVWNWPDPFDKVTVRDLRRAQEAVSRNGPHRKDSQAKNWVGHIIGRALAIDSKDKAGATKIKGIIKTWLKNEMLKEVEGLDQHRELKTFIEVGKWATDSKHEEGPTPQTLARQIDRLFEGVNEDAS